MLDNIKKFLQARHIIDLQEHHTSYTDGDTRYLRELTKRELKMVHLFEERMVKDIKFEKHVLSQIMVDRDIKMLTEFPDDLEIGGDMTARYNAIVGLMERYLNDKYKS